MNNFKVVVLDEYDEKLEVIEAKLNTYGELVIRVISDPVPLSPYQTPMVSIGDLINKFKD